MSWLFSAALMKECESLRSLQEPVAEYSAANCLDGEQSAPLSAMPTQHKFWRNDKTMEFSDLSRFGLTCAVLTESRGEELLKSFLAAFHAKTFPAQEREQELPESEADYGKNLPALLGKYDPDSCLWKTAQCSLFEDSELSLETFPRWGLMQSGALYLRETVALHTSGSESGLWPTPQKKQYWPTPRACDHKGTSDPVQAEKVLERGYNHNLPEAVAYSRKWPTPQASDNRDRGNLGSGAIQRRQEKGKQIMLSQSVSDISGALNPLWVEWLMGWPIGWTDLKPLATDRFRSWQQQHLGFYQGSEDSL